MSILDIFRKQREEPEKDTYEEVEEEVFYFNKKEEESNEDNTKERG